MNYFAHGRCFVDSPYFLAGTALPDWLNVIDRRAKARSRLAEPYCGASDERLADLARGIVQHHADDAWFHQTRAFAELSLEFAVRLRAQLPGDEGFRPSFLGHILVELLLDAALIADEPDRLATYYAALQQLDAEALAVAVNRLTTRPVERLPYFVGRFARDQFLYDYLDDQKLLVRLNHIMRRVGLPPLPATLTAFLAEVREPVSRRRAELLEPAPPSSFVA